MAVYRRSAASEVVAVQAGIGARRAAAGSRCLVQRFAPEALVSFGFAGGLLPGLPSGTLIVGDRLVGGDSRLPGPGADAALVATLTATAAAVRLPCRRGAVVTAADIVADPLSKAALARHTGACAVDMETAGVVEVACRHGLPWVALRAIVDTAEETLDRACLALVRADGRVALRRLIGALRRRPARLRGLIRLGWRAARARRHLGDIVAAWPVLQP
jgi:adenosylhomocysteine nucleosidase